MEGFGVMRYYKGDIVEIITAEAKSYYDIPDYKRTYYSNQGEPAPFVGQRFRLWNNQNDDKLLYGSYINKKGNHSLSFGIDSEFIILYERPLSNKIKYLLCLIGVMR